MATSKSSEGFYLSKRNFVELYQLTLELLTKLEDASRLRIEISSLRIRVEEFLGRVAPGVIAEVKTNQEPTPVEIPRSMTPPVGTNISGVVPSTTFEKEKKDEK